MDLPAVDELADAFARQFIPDRRAGLRPAHQAFEVDLVTAAHHDISDLAGGDGAADGASGDSEETGGFGDGNANDVHSFSIRRPRLTSRGVNREGSALV